MNRFIHVGKQVLVVALVAGVAAFLGASIALKSSGSPERAAVWQLVEDPKPCSVGC